MVVPLAAASDSANLELLGLTGLVSHFQPILSARQKCVVGLEALARGRLPGGELLAPLALFARAAAAGVLDDLDASCRRQAVCSFSRLRGLPHDVMLFLNLRVPQTCAPLSIAQELEELVATFRVPAGKVGVEILEAQIEDTELVQRLIDRLRESGFFVVLDDVGAGHSNLNRIPFIKPDVIKVDRVLVSDIDSDYHKRSAFKSLVDLGRKIGALVVAEGVETEGEALIALELGADLLQGHLLGRPGAIDSTGPEPLGGALERIGSLAKRFRGHMIEKTNDRKLQHRRFSVVMSEVLCSLTDAHADEFDRILMDAVGRYPTVECLYILDHAGVQVTDTIWNPHIQRRKGGVLFHPAPRGADHSLKEYYYILLDVELHRYMTDPYVSLASGSISRTFSTYFRDAQNDKMYVLCIDVVCT